MSENYGTLLYDDFVKEKLIDLYLAIKYGNDEAREDIEAQDLNESTLIDYIRDEVDQKLRDLDKQISFKKEMQNNMLQYEDKHRAMKKA